MILTFWQFNTVNQQCVIGFQLAKTQIRFEIDGHILLNINKYYPEYPLLQVDHDRKNQSASCVMFSYCLTNGLCKSNIILFNTFL